MLSSLPIKRNLQAGRLYVYIIYRARMEELTKPPADRSTGGLRSTFTFREQHFSKPSRIYGCQNPSLVVL